MQRRWVGPIGMLAALVIVVGVARQLVSPSFGSEVEAICRTHQGVAEQPAYEWQTPGKRWVLMRRDLGALEVPDEHADAMRTALATVTKLQLLSKRLAAIDTQAKLRSVYALREEAGAAVRNLTRALASMGADCTAT